MLTNRGFAAGRASTPRHAAVRPRRLGLPLPAAGPRVRADLSRPPPLEVGGGARLLGRRPQPDRRRAGPGAARPCCRRCRASSRRSTPLAMALIPPERAEAAAAADRARGAGPRRRRSPARRVSDEEQAAFDRADAEMFSLVRGIFGGHIKLAISGAAPIAPEILRFFYAAGVPVMEGWGMTETTAIGTLNLPDAHRFGTHRPRRRRRRHPHRRRRRDRDGRPDADEGVLAQPGRHRRGDDRRRVPAHRRPRARSTTTATSRSPGARRTSSSRPAARTSRRPTSRATCGGRGGSRRR